MDASGYIIVADTNNHRVRAVSPSGQVSTIAGNGNAAWADGSSLMASFSNPWGVVVNESGFILIADRGNRRIRAISPTGQVSTLAGNGNSDWQDGSGSAASFDSRAGVALTNSGTTLFFVDSSNNRIRTMSLSGSVTTAAGNNHAAWQDGFGTAASFYTPWGLAINTSGYVTISDQGNHRLRTISPTGQVQTIAGNGLMSWSDGTGTTASFNGPMGLATMTSGVILIAEAFNQRIRAVSPTGQVSTIAGDGMPRWQDGLGTLASFNGPTGVAVSASGKIFVSDTQNNRIRQISNYPPFSSVCTEGTSWTGRLDGCQSCPIGTFCPNGTSQAMQNHCVISLQFYFEIIFVCSLACVCACACVCVCVCLQQRFTRYLAPSVFSAPFRAPRPAFFSTCCVNQDIIVQQVRSFGHDVYSICLGFFQLWRVSSLFELSITQVNSMSIAH